MSPKRRTNRYKGPGLGLSGPNTRKKEIMTIRKTDQNSLSYCPFYIKQK